MAFSRISAEDVLENVFDDVFEDEQSLDDSDSEDGEDIYGYLGSVVVPRGELEGESRRLSRKLVDIDGDDDEASSQNEDEFDGDFGGEFNEPSLMECDDDGRSECYASGSTSLEDQVFLTHGEEVEDEAPTEMVRR